MKISKVLRPAAFGAAALVAVGVVGFVATSASAATIGPLTVSPSNGNLDTTVTINIDQTCPGGTNIQGRIEGAGFPAGGQNVSANYAQSTVAAGSGYSIPLVDTLRNIANLVTPPVTYSGSYTITFTCKNAFGATTFGDFVGTITFSDANTWAQAGGPSPSPSASASPSPSASASPSPSASASPSPSASASPSPSASASPSPSASASPSPTSSGGGGGNASVAELLKVTVPAGSLVISAQNTTVQLPDLKLNQNFTQYTTTGALNPVSVTDTRAGAPGFTVTGQASAFTGSGGSIDPSNLGWTPKVVSSVGTTVTAGPSVAPGAGLGSPKTLATGTGLGTAVLGADLALQAPITTKAGDYTSTLTITAI